MFPANTSYPKFVPDQLLTSGALNSLFSYVDEQERMTRTNLVGVGIVCGLHVKMDSSDNSVTITKGTGVTTEGYLVSIPETKYTKMKHFDHTKDHYFDSYATTAPALDLWELKEASTEEGMLDLADLDSIAVLLYVELPEQENKTCDPNSCDDKGITVGVNFRPFLVEKTIAQVFMNYVTNINDSSVTWFSSYVVAQELNEVRIRRFDVPGSNIVTTEDIVNGYRSVITQTVPDLQTACTNSYDLFSVLLQDEYPANPLEDIASKFDELDDSSVSLNNLMHIQYYYDFLSDMISAYAELRVAGTKLVGICCPDSAWFPRHLLLGEIVQTNPDLRSAVRHYFMYSPLFERQDLWMEVKLLFKRLVLISNKFFLPVLPKNSPVRITPSSKCCCSFLSKKAIPYYYDVKGPAEPYLYKYWNLEKRREGRSNQVLSYHATSYNTTDQFVRNPLHYDLDCQDFLRIEGIIGKPYKKVLKHLKYEIKTYRLPFKVIALRAGEFDIAEISATADDYSIQDLEINYDVARREWEAVIGKTIEYLHDNQSEAREMVGNANWVSFLKSLHKGKKFMVESLPLFIPSYHSFLSLFESLEKQAGIIRDSINERITPQGFLIIDLKYENRYDEEKLALAEDLIDHIDDVVMAVKKGPFRALYQEYNNRVVEVYKKTFLSDYLKSHPGIQHKAGVSMGGTFILVYHSKPFELKKKNQYLKRREVSETLTGVVLDDSGDPVQGVKVAIDGTSAATVTNSDGRFAIHANFLPATVIASAPGFNDARKLVNKSGSLIVLNFSDTEETEESVVDSIPDQTVIADFFLPYICCSEGQSININIKEEPEPPNVAPIAKAGSDITITLPTNLITLDGSSSVDPDGTVLKYEWTKITGPESFLITDPDGAITGVEGLIIGTYIFKLKVTDADDASHEDTITVTVNPKPNLLPVAEAGLDKTITLPTSSVLLDGTGSKDPDGGPLVYLWEKVSGGNATIVTPSAAQTVVNDLTTVGTLSSYTFKLTVTDSAGAKANDTTIVTVFPKPLVLPVARIAPVSAIQLPVNSILLDGTGSSDADGSIVKYLWTNNTPSLNAKIERPNDKTTEVTELIAGSYQFRLAVTDDDNLTGSATINIIVKAENQIPVAIAGTDTTIMINKEITMMGTGRDMDGTIESYLWSQKSGPSAFIDEPGNPKTVIKGFAKEGVYVFTLTVIDNQGAKGEDDITITVIKPNEPPVVDAGSDQTIPYYQQSILLKGSAEDPDGTIASIKWAQSSGPVLTGITNRNTLEPTITGLTKTGKYVFILQVTDDKGLSANDTVTVTVTDAPPPPTVNAGNDVTITMPVNEVTITATSTGIIAGYRWKQVGGPVTADIDTADKPVTGIRFLKDGKYAFEITAYDTTGFSVSDSVVVVVEPEIALLENPHASFFVEPSSPIMLGQGKFTLIGSESEPPPGGIIDKWIWTSSPSTLSFTDQGMERTEVIDLSLGDFNITLTVISNNGMSDAITQTVTIKGEQPVVKTCSPLQDIVTRFDKWKEKMPLDFPQVFDSFGDISEMFGVLRSVTSEMEELHFLDAIRFGDVAPGWFDGLNNLVNTSSKYRFASIVLYGILDSLAMQLSCIQDKDFRDAGVPTAQIFEMNFAHFLKWGAVIPDWTLAQKGAVKNIRTSFEMEIRQLQENGEETLKPEYFNALNDCLNVLSNMPL
jgi:hypothetical protein